MSEYTWVILSEFSNFYYKPSQKELLDDYLKTISNLTISKNNNIILEKEVKELQEKNENI